VAPTTSRVFFVLRASQPTFSRIPGSRDFRSGHQSSVDGDDVDGLVAAREVSRELVCALADVGRRQGVVGVRREVVLGRRKLHYTQTKYHLQMLFCFL